MSYIMPFKANIDGITVISVDMSDEEWGALKKAVRSKEVTIWIPCCGNLGYPRTSKLGVKHFVHKKGHKCNNWRVDSLEHIQIKAVIYSTCKEEGWNTYVEYRFNDCIADVLATNGERKIVFEVQLNARQ